MLKPGAAAFDNAVCAELNPVDRRSFLAWKTAAEAAAGCVLEPVGVHLFALCGKTSTSLVSTEELDRIEDALDAVLARQQH